MKVYHDRGNGITDISKKHLKRWLKRIRPIDCHITKEGHFTFQLFAEDLKTGNYILILESGFNCGYGGTGPHGTVWALKQLGLQNFDENIIFSNDRVYVHFGTNTIVS